MDSHICYPEARAQHFPLSGPTSSGGAAEVSLKTHGPLSFLLSRGHTSVHPVVQVRLEQPPGLPEKAWAPSLLHTPWVLSPPRARIQSRGRTALWEPLLCGLGGSNPQAFLGPSQIVVPSALCIRACCSLSPLSCPSNGGWKECAGIPLVVLQALPLWLSLRLRPPERGQQQWSVMQPSVKEVYSAHQCLRAVQTTWSLWPQTSCGAFRGPAAPCTAPGWLLGSRETHSLQEHGSWIREGPQARVTNRASICPLSVRVSLPSSLAALLLRYSWAGGCPCHP